MFKKACKQSDAIVTQDQGNQDGNGQEIGFHILFMQQHRQIYVHKKTGGKSCQTNDCFYTIDGVADGKQRPKKEKDVEKGEFLAKNIVCGLSVRISFKKNIGDDEQIQYACVQPLRTEDIRTS
jgi:hypothetical protein